MSAQDIRDFLLEFKQAATCGSGVDLVPRNETRATLAQLGLTKVDLEVLLLNLSVMDYCNGPEPDFDRTGEVVWIFGTRIQGKEIYIKLKVGQVGKQKIAKCISFHIAQFPLKYPHR
jgi:hypothetical protein